MDLLILLDNFCTEIRKASPLKALSWLLSACVSEKVKFSGTSSWLNVQTVGFLAPCSAGKARPQETPTTETLTFFIDYIIFKDIQAKFAISHEVESQCLRTVCFQVVFALILFPYPQLCLWITDKCKVYRFKVFWCLCTL